MRKEYNLKIITIFKENSESLEDIILKILNNNILFNSHIDIQNTTEYNKHK